MSPLGLILIYCALAAAASILGGWLPSLIRLTHLRQQLMMSLVSGVMLGVALTHMLPHSVEHLPVIWVGPSMLGGVLVMFFLLRIFHVHAHDAADDVHSAHADHDHREEHVPVSQPAQAHRHELRQANSPAEVRGLSWVGLFIGLAIHSLLDGVALAASVVADVGHDRPETWLLGLGTFLAVLLHKPLDALSITSLMTTAGWTERSRTIVNWAFALWCPLGALLFWFGTSQLANEHNVFVGFAMSFSAGFFLCIALSDLLPEVAFHSHDRVKLSAALLLGVAVSIAIEMTHAQYHPSHGEPYDHEQHSSQEQGL